MRYYYHVNLLALYCRCLCHSLANDQPQQSHSKKKRGGYDPLHRNWAPNYQNMPQPHIVVLHTVGKTQCAYIPYIFMQKILPLSLFNQFLCVSVITIPTPSTTPKGRCRSFTADTYWANKLPFVLKRVWKSNNSRMFIYVSVFRQASNKARLIHGSEHHRCRAY